MMTAQEFLRLKIGAKWKTQRKCFSRRRLEGWWQGLALSVSIVATTTTTTTTRKKTARPPHERSKFPGHLYLFSTSLIDVEGPHGQKVRATVSLVSCTNESFFLFTFYSPLHFVSVLSGLYYMARSSSRKTKNIMEWDGVRGGAGKIGGIGRRLTVSFLLSCFFCFFYLGLERNLLDRLCT